jgi:hypothetical protein
MTTGMAMADQNVKPVRKPIKVINVGLELFAEALVKQGVEVAQVMWTPPAQGDPELMGILDDLL